MHAAFLSDRKMCVKIGNVLLQPHPVTGGAVQGSVLGVMDHNAVMEHLEGEDGYQDFYKYIDDLTLQETVGKEVATMIDNSGFPPTHFFRPQKTQQSIDRLTEKCDEMGLKINEKKTQLLTISSARNENNAWIEMKDGTVMYSGSEQKSCLVLCSTLSLM